MGWTTTDDCFSQVRLKFPSLTAAVAYAKRNNLDYRVINPLPRRHVHKDYREAILGPDFSSTHRLRDGPKSIPPDLSLVKPNQQQAKEISQWT